VEPFEKSVSILRYNSNRRQETPSFFVNEQRMLASRLNPFVTFVHAGRLRQTVIVLGLLILLGLCGWGGVHLWADREFRAAQQALAKGRIAQAQGHIRSVLNVRPRDADAHFLAARIERRVNKFAAAEDHLKTYKKIRGVTDEYQTEWILLRAQGGESAKFEQSLWNCVEQNHPQSLEILETLAGCFVREGRFFAALNCLNEWLKRDPGNPVALTFRGLARQNLQQPPDEAAADYQAVLAVDPDRWQARLRLAHLLMDMSRLPEAWQHLEILNASHGKDEGVQMARGTWLFHSGKAEEARQVFLHLVDGDYKAPALFYLGRLENDRTKAEQSFRRALEIQPDYLEARYALYACLQQAGRGKEAADQLRVYQAGRDAAELIKKLQVRMESSPYNPDLLSDVGGRLLEEMDNPQGLKLVQRALSLDPNHRRAHQILARYYEKHAQPEQAAKHRQLGLAAKKSP
jgi:tetratricopeptide (TPR) repeat protein